MKLIAEEKALDVARDKLMCEVGARARARLFGSSLTPTPRLQSVPGDTVTQGILHLPLSNQSMPIITSEQHQNGGFNGGSFSQVMSRLEPSDTISGIEQQYGGMTFPVSHVPLSTLPSSQSVRSIQTTDNEGNLISSSSSSSATSNGLHSTVHASAISSSDALLGTEIGTTGLTGNTGCTGLMGLSDDVCMSETVISPASSAPTSTSTAAIINGSVAEVMEDVSSISAPVPSLLPPPGAPVPTPVHAPEGHNDGREQELDLESLVMTPTSTSEHIITATKSPNNQIDPPNGILTYSSLSAQDSNKQHNGEKESDIIIEIDEAGDEYLSSLNYSFVSFISYPFVLSSSSKAGVLECDATQQMRRGDL